MVSQDLERYYGALDRALMAFHASKMSDINRVVRELWQRTYRGRDIDYIQIRSDDDGAAKLRQECPLSSSDDEEDQDEEDGA